MEMVLDPAGARTPWVLPGPILFNVFIHDLDPGWTLMVLRVFPKPNDSIPLESKGLGNEEHTGPGWIARSRAAEGGKGAVHHPSMSLTLSWPPDEFCIHFE